MYKQVASVGQADGLSLQDNKTSGYDVSMASLPRNW